MRSAAVILNPIAGAARGRLGPERIHAALRTAGYESEVVTTSGPGQGAETAARAAERHPLVVAVGGDGTVSEVARGLAEGPAAMAVIPTGSGNDFAQGLGIRSVDDGIAALLSGRRRALDTATFADRFFVNSCGLFLNGEISLRAAGVPRFWGRHRYPIATLAELGRRRAVRARWRVLDGTEGETLDDDWTLAEIGNGVQCGGGFRLTPRADPGDGLLDACLVRRMPLGALLRTLPRTADGGHLDSPYVLYVRGATIEVAFDEDTAVHWDGEAERIAAGTWRFETKPASLTVLVPGEER